MSRINSFSQYALQSGLQGNINQKINLSEKGAVNGVCPLNSAGLIDVAYFDPSVLTFMGSWNASTNVPILANGTGGLGDIYIVGTAGIQFGISFVASDFIIYDGSQWKKIEGAIGVTALTTNNTFLLDIDNTIPNQPLLKPMIGSRQPFLYRYNSPSSDGSNVAMNNATISSVTQIEVGFYPANRGPNSEYVKHQLNYLNKYLPAYARFIDTTNTANYASFIVNSVATTGAYSYTYNASYVAGDTTITSTYANNTLLHLIFELAFPNGAEANTMSSAGGAVSLYKGKTGVNFDLKGLTAGTGMTITDNTTYATIATTAEANTGANVGTGAGNVYRDKTGATLNFKTINAGTGMTVTNNANDVTIATTAEANTMSSAGGAVSLYKGKTGVNFDLKGLTAGTGMTITDNTTYATIASTAIGSISSSNTYLTNINNTNPLAPIVQPLIGSKTPFLYSCNTTALTSGAEIYFYGASPMSTVTLIDIGWLPLNRSTYNVEHIRSYFDFVKRQLPFYIRIIDPSGNYATFLATVFSGTGSYDYVFTVAYQSGESSGTVTMTTGTLYNIFIEHVGEINTMSNSGGAVSLYKGKTGVNFDMKGLTAGTNMIVTDNTNYATIATSAEINTGANVGTGAGTVYRDKTGTILNFKSILAGASMTVTNNANDITLAPDFSAYFPSPYSQIGNGYMYGWNLKMYGWTGSALSAAKVSSLGPSSTFIIVGQMVHCWFNVSYAIPAGTFTGGETTGFILFNLPLISTQPADALNPADGTNTQRSAVFACAGGVTGNGAITYVKAHTSNTWTSNNLNNCFYPCYNYSYTTVDDNRVVGSQGNAQTITMCGYLCYKASLPLTLTSF